MPASTGSLWTDTAPDDGPFARSLQPLRLLESSLIRLWNAVPQPMFFPMSASQFRHQSWHRLHECGNRKHRLCRIVLQRGGHHHLLLLSLGVRAWWKCRALNKMMENHPQKRQLYAWFFHQFWRSSHLFSKITLPLKFRALKSSWAIFSWFPTFHVRMKLNRQESEGNDL